MNALSIIEKLLSENNGIISTADAVHAGISRTVLGLLVKSGCLERIAHGHYILPEDLPDELLLLQRRSDKIIFSHETALSLHGISERIPLKPSLTIPSNNKLSPALSDGCKIYYVRQELYNLGRCSAISMMGHEVITYDAERTVCDILRSRSRIESQTYVAAIKNYVHHRGKDWHKLIEYAEAFHVEKLLRQYLEVLF